MDVSTSILHDPKFVKLARSHPELAGNAFTVYSSTMAESWHEGQRLSAGEAWPVILPRVDRAVIDALREVRLLDAKDRVTVSAWREFFERARDRREKARDRWRRGNDKRAAEHVTASTNDSADTTRRQRGSDAVTEANVLSVPYVPYESDSLSLSGETPPAPAREAEPDVESIFGPTTTTTDDRKNGREKPDSYAGAHGMSRVGDALPRGLRR
jgi:hypothetical protein